MTTNGPLRGRLSQVKAALLRKQWRSPRRKWSEEDTSKERILSTVKSNFPLSDISQSVNHFFNDPALKECFSPFPFPGKIKDIRKGRYLSCVDIERELLWTATILSHYTTELNEFIQMSHLYAQYYFSSSWLECNRVLDGVKDKFGYSLWYIQNKLQLLEISSGFSANKSFVKQVLEDTSVSGDVRLLSHFFSVRSEKNISYNRFKSTIQDYFKIKKNEKPWKEYLLYRLDPFRFAPEDHLKWIIAADDVAPIIDRYGTFIRICQNICVSGYSKHFKYVLESLGLLSGIKDDLIKKIQFSIDPKTLLQRGLFSYFHIKNLDQYTSGLYEDSFKNAWTEVDKNPLSFESYEIIAKSIVYGNLSCAIFGESLRDQTIKLMVSILRRDETSAASYQDLLKIAVTCPSSSSLNQIFSFVMREHSLEYKKNFSQNGSPGELSSREFSPRSSEAVHRPLRPIASMETERLLDGSSSAIIYSLSMGNLEKEKVILTSIPEYRRLKHRAMGLMVHNNFLDAALCFEKILMNATPGTVQGALCGAIECLLRISDIEKCCELVAKWCLDNQVFAQRLPLEKIAKSVENSKSKVLAKKLSYPIFFDVLTKCLGPQKYNFRYEAYDDFMQAMNIERPSQLASISNVFLKDRLVYFLRECCDRSVLELSRHIKSSYDVEQERMAICQTLITLDEENNALYSREIKEISHKLLVNRGTQAFDQSKIFVNIEGIRIKTRRDMKEVFGRYLDFVTSPADASSKQVLVIRLSGTSGAHADMHLASSEKTAIFSDIFLALREDFIASNEYGLDSYLSVRIRHGTLAGQLRRPFEILHLITQRDARNIYGENEYWKSIISVSPEKLKQIMKALVNFSAKIDTEISRVKNCLIQIKTEVDVRNKEGLFDYSYSHMDLVKLEIDFGLTGSIDEDDLYKFCFNELWKKTEDGLKIIRRFIHKDLRDLFIKALDALSGEIAIVAEPDSDNGIDQLISSITKSKTDVQTSLSVVENWFTRRDPLNAQDCSIQEIFSIAISTINNVNPHSLITPAFNSSGEGKIMGAHVTHMVAIFYILLENIVKKSGFYGNIPVVSIDIVESIAKMEIIVVSQMTEEVLRDPENISKINDAKQIAAGRSAEGLVKQEGGSGFSKIRKLLRTDLGRNDFKIHINTVNSQFSVSISFDPRGLLA